MSAATMPPPTAPGAATSAANDGALDMAAMFREHHAFVWRVVRRLGVDPAAVDDVVQEVFLVLFRRRHELDVQTSPRGLLYGIARRVAARQRTVRKPTLTLVESDASTSGVRSAEQLLALDQAATVVRDALDAMDEDKRMTFLLADVEGMTMPEISACMDVNLNTAYARLRAARSLLEKAVSRHRAKEEGLRVRAERR